MHFRGIASLESFDMPKPIVSIIILNFNGRDLLKECIDSLLETLYSPIEIIVADNGSSDGSIDFVRETYLAVIIVDNKVNIGYAAGNNRGIAAATGKYVVTLNNDVVVEPSWLDEAISFIDSHEDVGIIACRQMDYYNRDRIDSLYSVPTPFLLLQRGCRGEKYNASNPLHGKTGYSIGANGASAIYRKAMFSALGGFEESFFAYQEENDLQMRCFLNGWKCFYVPSAVVIHKGSVSFNKTPKAFYYYHERNRIWFIYRCFPTSIIARYFVVILLREIRTMINIIFVRKIPCIYLKARYDGFCGVFKFSAVRKGNIQNFKNRYKEYQELEKHNLIPIEKVIA